MIKFRYLKLVKALLIRSLHKYGSPVLTPNPRWSQITFEHHPAHMSSFKPNGWDSPMGGKNMAGPMSSRSKARFMADIGNRDPCKRYRTIDGRY